MISHGLIFDKVMKMIEMIMIEMTITMMIMMIDMMMMMMMMRTMMIAAAADDDDEMMIATCVGVLVAFHALHFDDEVSIIADDPSILHLHRIELGQVVVREHRDACVRYLISMFNKHEIILREACHLLPIRISGLD